MVIRPVCVLPPAVAFDSVCNLPMLCNYMFHIDPVLWKGINCHFELNWVLCTESFNWWSSVICQKITTPSSRITKMGGGYPTSQKSVICRTEPSSSLSSRIGVLWVVPFLQNMGDLFQLTTLTVFLMVLSDWSLEGRRRFCRGVTNWSVM